jgi:hypothetical protein
MCWEKDWYMCSMMCIIVLKDWYMCSRIGSGPRRCICVQGCGMCWEKDVIDWALRVRYKLW